jgi:hypothetical protein
MGDYTRALTDGVVGNEQLVGTFAEKIPDRIVVKMTTNLPQQRLQPQAMKTMRSPGFPPRLLVTYSTGFSRFELLHKM